MIAWPREIISDLARRRTVLFLGSGISRNSSNNAGKKPKSWLAFLNAMVRTMNSRKHIKELLKERDYLTACEVIKKTLGRDAFHQRLKEEFLNPGYKHSSI